MSTNQAMAQEVCIDLPGESVQCWRSSDHVKILLRKHRDVIFHMRLKAGQSYSVATTETDFYNARDKKLVRASRLDIVHFSDGERFHIWVPRNFTGALLLRCGAQLLMRLVPSQLDPHWYDDHSKTKAAPIIVAMGSDHAAPPSAADAEHVANSPAVQAPRPVVAASAPEADECAIVCVVDGSRSAVPQHILDYFSKGGGQSGFAINPFDVATRNWIWGQVLGSAAFVGDNIRWLRESVDSRTHQGLKFVSVKIHRVGGRIRYYFSGYSKFNKVFGPGGFGPGHEKILSIFAGAGKTSSTFMGAAKGIAGAFKGMALVSFIFGSATAILEWKEDIKKDGYDLAAGLLMAVLKAVITAIIVSCIVALICLISASLLSASIPVLVVGVITVGVGVIVNYNVEKSDKSLGRGSLGNSKNTDGMAGVLAPYLRGAGEQIQSSWDLLMNKFPHDYRDLTW